MAVNTIKNIETAFKTFQNSLKEDEVPVLELILNDGTKIIVDKIVHYNPHLLHIFGSNYSNEDISALVHQNTVQFIIRSIKIPDEDSKNHLTSENLKFMYQ